MKVKLYLEGFAERVDYDDCIYMENLVNDSSFEVPRVPCIGESVGLWIEDVWIDARVVDVSTHFIEHGNPHFKESAWGTEILVSLGEAVIVERYKK